MDSLVEDLLAGDYRALARVLTTIENRSDGYRETVSELYRHTGTAHVVGVTGSPGVGKSTLVDRVATALRNREKTVGIIAIDPSSPFTGGAILGDRIRMSSNAGDMDVFVRSMSTRGSLGGLSTATTDAVTALDAFGMDTVIVETVGAGQNEIDVVRTADTVAVLVPPGSGDDVQMLKAGILEIADLFAVNKADLDGADRTVGQLREMLHYRTDDERPDGETADSEDWTPPIVETVANRGDGVGEFVTAIEDHAEYLDVSGRGESIRRTRTTAAIEWLLREEISTLVESELERRGGIDHEIDRILAGKSDPYTVVSEVLGSVSPADTRE